jgi:hypothetical protein
LTGIGLIESGPRWRSAPTHPGERPATFGSIFRALLVATRRPGKLEIKGVSNRALRAT